MNLKVLFDHCHRPYLVRLELVRLFGWSLKLHVFLRSDADLELHDHPWDFWTLVIAGRYVEHCEGHKIVRRGLWSLAYRPAEWKHRVHLEPHEVCATIVLTRPARRPWGFWRRGRFIPWREFVSNRRCD